MAHRLDSGPIARPGARRRPTVDAAGQKPNFLSLNDQMQRLVMDHQPSHMNRPLKDIGHEDLVFPAGPCSGPHGVAVRQLVKDGDGFAF